MSIDSITSDIEQRIRELQELGFNVNFEFIQLSSYEKGIVFKITRKPKQPT
jgi:hypothetical protein